MGMSDFTWQHQKYARLEIYAVTYVVDLSAVKLHLITKTDGLCVNNRKNIANFSTLPKQIVNSFYQSLFQLS